MLVKDIMTAPAVTVRDHASPMTALRLLAERCITTLPVVDARGRLVGVLSEVDLIGLPDFSAAPPGRLPVTRKPRPLPLVGDLMTRSPQTTTEDAEVAQITAGFRRTSWKCLPVIRDERPIGVVSRSDVVRALARYDDEIADEVNEVLGRLASGWSARVSDGIATLSGPGFDRDRESAASLAASVVGVRAIAVAEVPRDETTPEPLTGWVGGWSVNTDRESRLSGGMGADQL